VGKEIIRAGKHAAYYSPSVDFSDDELSKLQRDIDALYDDFVSKMAKGRGLDVAAVEVAAQGRVWTGAQAKEHQLVDELGGASDVLDALRAQLGLGDAAPLELVAVDQPSLVERVRRARGRAQAALFGPLVVDELAAVASFADPAERLWLRMPFDVRLF
jgi:protease-4